jgi:hypothetical protein
MAVPKFEITTLTQISPSASLKLRTDRENALELK